MGKLNSIGKSPYVSISLLIGILLLSACQTNGGLFGPSEREIATARLNAQNERNITAVNSAIRRYHQLASSIRLGQSLSEVLRILSPAKVGLSQFEKLSEAFKLDGKTIEIHYMRSSWIPDGNKTDDEFTPYSFVDGTLTAIGWRSLGGVKTHGDTAAVERRRAAAAQLILRFMGQQQQQRQHQDRMNLERQNRMQRLLTPPKPNVECRTQYFGNSSRTVCN